MHHSAAHSKKGKGSRYSITERRQWLNYSAIGGLDPLWLEEPKLEAEGPKGEVGFPTADQM